MTGNPVAISGAEAPGSRGDLAAEVDPSARACAVHLQLRGLEHERDDHGHQQGPEHRRAGCADRDHPLPPDHGDPDDPVQQADRPVGPEAVPQPGPHAVRGRRAAERGRAEPRRADPRELGVRGRRDGASDPAGLHPRHALVQRPHLAGLGLRRDQRARRDRRSGRAVDRRSDRDGDRLAGRVRLPGRRRRDDPPAEPSPCRSAPGRPDAAIRRRRGDPVGGRHVLRGVRDPAGRHPQRALRRCSSCSDSRSWPGSMSISAPASERGRSRSCPPGCSRTAPAISPSSRRTCSGCCSWGRRSSCPSSSRPFADTARSGRASSSPPRRSASSSRPSPRSGSPRGARSGR